MKHTRYPRLATKQSQSSGLSLLWVGIMSLWNRGCKFSHFMALLINVIKISTQLKKNIPSILFLISLEIEKSPVLFPKCEMLLKSEIRFPKVSRIPLQSLLHNLTVRGSLLLVLENRTWSSACQSNIYSRFLRVLPCLERMRRSYPHSECPPAHTSGHRSHPVDLHFLQPAIGENVKKVNTW